MSGPYFAAFCLAVARPIGDGPRVGFTLPRAFGKSVKRNRAKRRIRELLRVRMTSLDPRWDVVINPRRQALDASPEQLQREVERLVSRCGKP
jgi:ribonuclease P protein component